MLDNIMGGACFSNLLLKLVGNEYCSKLEKESRFQVIYTPKISYSLEFSLEICI